MVIAVALTLAIVFVAGWMVGGGMFSRSASFGVATVLLGCALASTISGVLWIGIVVAVIAAYIGFIGICAGEN